MGGWVKKGKGLSQEKKILIDTDNGMVITREKEGLGEIEEGKEGTRGDDLTQDDDHTIYR